MNNNNDMQKLIKNVRIIQILSIIILVTAIISVFILPLFSITSGLWIASMIFGIILLKGYKEKNNEGLITALGICAIIPFTCGLVCVIISSILLHNLKKTSQETEVQTQKNIQE